MKRKRNSAVAGEKRRRSSISSDSSLSVEQPLHKQKTCDTSNASISNVSEKQSNIKVRLQNTDMLTKYRNKNEHIHIEHAKSIPNFIESELSEEDEVWICEIPNSTDVNELIGKSVKLGHKRCSIKIEQAEMECVSSKFKDMPSVHDNVQSVVLQNKNSQLFMKNLKPVGRLTVHEKIAEMEPSTDVGTTSRHECTVFPDMLVVRHPIFGRYFEDKINVTDEIKRTLSDKPYQNVGLKIQVKQELEDSPKRKHNEMKSIKNSKQKMKEGNTNDDDLSRIRLIFEKN